MLGKINFVNILIFFLKFSICKKKLKAKDLLNVDPKTLCKTQPI